MAIKFICSNCSTKLGVPDAAAGKTVKCPKCQTAVKAPALAPKVEDLPPLELEPVNDEVSDERDDGAPDDYDDDSPLEPRRASKKSGKRSKASKQESKRLICAFAALLLGGVGAHKFIYGANTAGIITILVVFLTCGLGAIVMGPICLVEAIIYLTKTDEQFIRDYQIRKKAWF